MRYMDLSASILAESEALLESVKEATLLTLAEARTLNSQCREAQGWLMSVRDHLDPNEKRETPMSPIAQEVMNLRAEKEQMAKVIARFLALYQGDAPPQLVEMARECLS